MIDPHDGKAILLSDSSRKTAVLVPTDRLLPCPFCGGNDIRAFKDGDKFLITCASCHVFGSLCAEPEAAVKAWNRRPQ